MILHGDCLDVMSEMRAGAIDLIYADPPFNTGRDFGEFDDRWQADEYLETMRAVALETKRLLKDGGSMWLHCDPTASHYLKVMMDSVYGIKSFRNEVVWCYTGRGSSHSRQFNRKHDVLLWYSVGKSWTFNGDAVRVPSRLNKGGGFETAPQPTEEERLAYMEKGKVPDSWWAEAKGNGLTTAGRQKNQYVGWPTQKPLALLERIVKACSNPGDVVLDPFMGSGTTCVAAKRLGRKWIGIDKSCKAVETAQMRLDAEGGCVK